MDIRKTVFDLVRCGYTGPVTELPGQGLRVIFDGTHATIRADTVPARARGYMLLARAIARGETLDICQSPAFGTLGVMLDVSRGGVMNVSSVKKYLEYLALHGMNMLMLYTEDTYTLEDYPYFGYQRGRYTLQELQQIDDYAYELGIEVIPCIQTFGHLEQYLRYPAAAQIRDSDSVLLVGEEKTYDLIRACIATMRKAFRSDRIHIGCDETRGLGLGQYLNIHGYRDRFTVFNEHLERVTQLCREYGYRPMMWSDMYFTLADKNRVEDYAPDVVVPQYAIDAMPDCDMVFWEYYHTQNDFYRINIEKHKTFNRPVIFAGGIWTQDGMVVNHAHTYNTMKPAMEECLRGGIDSVIITLWSNDGCEASHMLGIPSLSLFSEYCWLGQSCTERDIWDVCEFVTGMNRELAYGVSDFFFRYDGAVRAGKHILWSDPLVNLLISDFDLEAGQRYLSDGLKVFEANSDYKDSAYFAAVFRACLGKVRLHANLRDRYKAGDRAWLAAFAREELPAMIRDFEQLLQLHHDSWHADYKTQGFERIMCRYFAAIGRLKYTAEVIEKYLSGELTQIEALEPEVLHDGIRKWSSARAFMYIAAH